MPDLDSIRRGLHAWIDTLDPQTLHRLHQYRRGLDRNMRKPPPPDGWLPLRDLAATLHRHPDHLGRLAVRWAATGQALLCQAPSGQTAWYVSPSAIPTPPNNHLTIT